MTPPPEIYLRVKHDILTPIFLERNIFWFTGQLIIRKIILITVASCHQLSDFKAKTHQIRFRLTPLGGSLQGSLRPSSWI